MSASREKKQRQGGTPSDKTLTAKQQAEQTRRKTIQYTVIGAVVALLVAALLVWDSGFFQARATAATVGGTNYTAAQTSYFYHTTRSYLNMMNYGIYYGYDTGKSPAEQTYRTDEETGEVTTYHDYFLEAALEDMSSITALYDDALKNGMTAADVKDELNAAIDNAKQTAKQYGVSYKQLVAGYYGSYVTPSVYEDCLTRVIIASVYQDAHQDGLTYTGDQLRAYYDEHKDELDTFQYSYLYFTPAAVETKDADGNDIEMTDEEKETAEAENLAEAKATADDAKEALEGGTSVADVIEAFDPTSYGGGEETDGSGVSSVYREWLADTSRKAGDVTVVESSTSGYYVVLFEGRFLDKTPTRSTRHILIEAESTGSDAPTEDQMNAAKAEAERLLETWKAGDATAESFGELANAHSDDTGSNSNGGLYEKVYKGQFVPNYDAWLFDDGRQVGDSGLVENNGSSYYGWHAVYYQGENPDIFKWMVIAESALTSEDTQTWLEGLKANAPAQAANGAKYLGK